MSELGRTYIANITAAHGLDPALFDVPLLQGELVPFAPGLAMSLRRDVDPPAGFEASLSETLTSVCIAEVAIAGSMDRDCEIPYGHKLQNFPAWRINGTEIRDALRPGGVMTGTLSGFSLQIVDPSELTISAQKQLFRYHSQWRRTVEDSEIALSVNAKHLGKLVACALGIQLRDIHHQGEPHTPLHTYISGKVWRMPAQLRSAEAEAALRRDLADVREQERRQLPGDFERGKRD